MFRDCRRFRDEFDRLKAKGYEPTKIAAALMPIMLGQPVDDVVRVSSVHNGAQARDNSTAAASIASLRLSLRAVLTCQPMSYASVLLLSNEYRWPRFHFSRKRHLLYRHQSAQAVRHPLSRRHPPPSRHLRVQTWRLRCWLPASTTLA